MRVYELQILENIDLSLASTSSQVASMESMFGYSIQAIFTGNATGNLLVEGSNSPLPYSLSSNITTFSTITTIPIAAPGNFIINTSDVQYKYIRLTYVRTGGAGHMDAFLCGKGF